MIERYLEIWRAYGEEGLDGFIEHCAPDLVAEEYAGVPGAEVWHGVEGLRAMWSRWVQDLADFQFEPIGEPQQLASRVFARRVRVRGTGRLSGVEVDWMLVMGTTLRPDGLVTHQILADTVEEVRARLC